MLEKERYNWLDIIKAFAIFFIVLGHALNGYGLLWKWVYGFHVPLFVFASGLVYAKKKEAFSTYAWRKIKSILVPYYCFAIVSIGIYYVIGPIIESEQVVPLVDCIKGMLWANGETGLMRWNLPLWYLPMFILLQIIAFWVLQQQENIKTLWLKFAISLIIATICYYSELITNLPFAAETVVYLFPFYILGIICKNYISYIEKIKQGYALTIAGVSLVVGTYVILIQRNVDYVSDEYRIYPLFILAACLISLSFVLFTVKITITNNILLYVGRNTMAILLMHKFPLMFFEYMCPGTKDIYGSHRGIASVVISILSIVLCLLVGEVLKKIMPWVLGERRIVVKGGKET